jgi:rhamnosyltransferase
VNKIAATTILYNPDKSIFDNLDSYVYSVDKIFIIDNSEIQQTEIVEQLESRYSNLIYIFNNDNLGIATALNIACDRAMELGYEWILTMDQDSRFINFAHYLDCLYKLSVDPNIALLAGNATRNALNQLPLEPTCSFEEKFLVITSGNLLNLKLFNEIGRFEDKLFIDMVDHDYCMKINKKGYKILYLRNVLIEHNLGDLYQRQNILTGKIRKKIEHSPIRVYYITRNYFYTWQKYSKDFPQEFNLLKTLNMMFIHGIIKILLYEDNKMKKIYAKFLGLWHFLIGKYGKYRL